VGRRSAWRSCGDFTSRHFQPCAETFDNRFQFVGPSLALAGTSDAKDERGRRSPVVYVSLGTLFNADTAFYRACFEAFGQEDIDVIMSIGTNVSEASLGQAPPNVVVRPHVPQLEVLGRASAFVTHGGMNSVSESLFQGVPVVVIPQMGEQEVVGRRVEEVGAGIYLAKRDVSAEKLRESVARRLADGRFREQAAVLRDSFRNAGGVARAADAILAFTRRTVSQADHAKSG